MCGRGVVMMLGVCCVWEAGVVTTLYRLIKPFKWGFAGGWLAGLKPTTIESRPSGWTYRGAVSGASRLIKPFRRGFYF